jgi:ferric-dicitrate binding protein FerR (iron transport regulator)
MNDLIVRHLMAETTPEEETRLLEWRRSSSENEALYRRQLRLWKLLASARAEPDRPVPTADLLVARAGIRSFPGGGDELRSPTRQSADAAPSRASFLRSRLRVGWIGVAIAAGIAALTLVVPRLVHSPSFGAVEFIAGPHEAHTIRLDDGTVVRLAPGSRLQFDGNSARERRVIFEGVGYFAVAHDASRPFIIRTDGGEAEVLGTRFELRAEREAMRVVVVEGRVALEAEGRRAEVAANQVAYAGTDQPPTVAAVEDVNDLLTWVDDLLVFQATPLRQVVLELEQHYGVEIDLLDPRLAERQVTAWLREQSFDAALTAICGAVNASCVIQRDRATMDLP